MDSGSEGRKTLKYNPLVSSDFTASSNPNKNLILFPTSAAPLNQNRSKIHPFMLRSVTQCRFGRFLTHVNQSSKDERNPKVTPSSGVWRRRALQVRFLCRKRVRKRNRRIKEGEESDVGISCRLWWCQKAPIWGGRGFPLLQEIMKEGRYDGKGSWFGLLVASVINKRVRYGKNRQVGAYCSLVWRRCSSWSRRSWRYRGREWRRSEGRWGVGEVFGSGASGRRRWAGGHLSVTNFSRGKESLGLSE